ncbi:MAG: hypothetical protein LDL51_11500, partial [Chloroflexi bacterium]|nr:hypothetical protein [Chloroflexota bacterium]
MGYIPNDLFNRLKSQIDESIRIINGYIAYLKRSKRGENEPVAKRFVQESHPNYFTKDPTDP